MLLYSIELSIQTCNKPTFNAHNYRGRTAVERFTPAFCYNPIHMANPNRLRLDPEEEHGGIVSGQIRDFTRRYGDVTPDEEGQGLRDSSGILWRAIDSRSVTTILFGGLRRVEPARDTFSSIEDQEVQ